MTDSHELSVTRHIDAPVAAVWRAWTQHLAEWFTPPPWTTELIAQDLRAGGRSAMVMRGPNGEENALEGVFLEVIPERLIVSTDAIRSDWTPQGPFMIRLDAFEPDGTATRYTATARHWTAEAMEQHRAMGFEQGWGIVADQLAAVAMRVAAEG